MTRVNDYTAMKVKVPSMLLPFCILVSRATIDTAPSVPTWIMDAPGDSYIAAVTFVAGLYPIGSVPARTDVQVLISALTPTPVTCTTTTRPHASAQIEPYATAIGESCTLTRDTEYYNGIAIQFIVHVILGYVDAAFQTSIVNPVDVLLYTISLTEGHPHVSNFGN